MKAALSFAILAFSAGAALADGIGVPPTPPVVPSPPIAYVPDWTGVYAGLYYGVADGEMFDIGGPYVLNDNANFGGLMLGYRRDLGNFVIGGEIASTFHTDVYQAAFPSWAFNNLTDLRVSVGRDLGRALLYATAGYTTSRFTDGFANYTYDGWNAGIGIDYMVTDRVFLGAEYVYRSLARTDNSAWTGEFGAIQLRGGIRF